METSVEKLRSLITGYLFIAYGVCWSTVPSKNSDPADPAFPTDRGQCDCHQYLVYTKLSCIEPYRGERCAYRTYYIL